MAEKPQPVRVLYCEVCSLPAEYCEFGPDFDKCKPWLVQNAPELYPDLLKEANERDAVRAADQLQATGISDGSGGGVGPSTQSGSSTSASKPEEVKRLPGGKIKKKEKQEVVIEKIVRNKRKCVTVVKGLELFGVKLSDASKKLGRKFATGASVVKGPTEKEQIDVQGDISYDIVEFITNSWPAHLLVIWLILILITDLSWMRTPISSTTPCHAFLASFGSQDHVYEIEILDDSDAASTIPEEPGVDQAELDRLIAMFVPRSRPQVTFREVPESSIFFIEDGRKVAAA